MEAIKKNGTSTDILLATIYNPNSDMYVYVYEDGKVKLELGGKVLEVGIESEQKREWFKFCYIRDLIRSGITKKELAEAIKQIDEADERLREESWEEALASDFEYGREHFKDWCVQKGIDYDKLTDSEAMELFNQSIHQWRRSNAKSRP